MPSPNPIRPPSSHETQTAPLTRWGGLLTGFAQTYSNALRASRAEVIDAVDGPDPVDTLVLVNGHRGTDYASGATNRTRSDDHPEHEGVDRIFIATTPAQFEALAERVGADVQVT
jgi:hypothetical protein